MTTRTCTVCGKPTSAGTASTGPLCAQHYVQAIRDRAQPASRS